MKRFLKYIKENESPLSSIVNAVENIKTSVKRSGYHPEVTKRALDALAYHHGMLRATRLDFKKATATRDENGVIVQPLEFAHPAHKELHGHMTDAFHAISSAWNHVIDGATDAGHFDIGGPLRKHVSRGTDTAIHFANPEEWSTTDGAGPHDAGFTTHADPIPERRRNARMKKLEEAIAKHISLLIEAAEDWTDYPKGAREKRKLTPEEEEHYYKNVNHDQLIRMAPDGRVTGRRGYPNSPPTLGDVRALAAKARPGSSEHADALHRFVNRFEGLGDKITEIPDSHVGAEYPAIKYMRQARDVAKHLLNTHIREMGRKARKSADFSWDMDSQIAHTGQMKYHLGTPYSDLVFPEGHPLRRDFKIQVNSYTPDLDDAFRTILKEEVYCLRENASEKELSRIMMFDKQKLQDRLFDMSKAYHAISKHLEFSSSAPNIIPFGSSEKTADGLRKKKDSQGRFHILSPVPTHIIRAKSEAGSISNTPISTAVPVADVEKMKEKAHGHIVNLVNKISSMDPTTNHAELNDLVNRLHSDKQSFPSWTSRSALDDYVGSDSEHQGLLHGIRQKFGVVNLHNILKKPEIVDALHKEPITIQADIVSKKPKKKDLGESIVKRGDDWLVMDSKKKKVLGTHGSEKKAKAQLAAIEISKAGRSK